MNVDNYEEDLAYPLAKNLEQHKVAQIMICDIDAYCDSNLK
jgi:hypothetical protein